VALDKATTLWPKRRWLGGPEAHPAPVKGAVKKGGTFPPPQGEKFVKKGAKPFSSHLERGGSELFPEDPPVGGVCNRRSRDVDWFREEADSLFAVGDGTFDQGVVYK